jgi:hypothetical protein
MKNTKPYKKKPHYIVILNQLQLFDIIFQPIADKTSFHYQVLPEV